jgi:hypothetical protein
MPRVKLEKHSRQGTAEEPVGRKVESPSKNQTRADRPRKRVPVSGFRDILTVHGKDPDYEYRWVKDGSESGQRIWRYQQAAYQFVLADELEGVGQNFVYQTEDLGSLVRVPSGKGEYHYLMKISKEFYDEDQADKEKELRKLEENQARSDPGEGQYGSGTITPALEKS